MRKPMPGAIRTEGASPLRVLGVDPGTVSTGWGAVQARGAEVRYVASGVLSLSGARAVRLAALYDSLAAICVEVQPSVLAIEKTFVGDNVQSAFRLGEARGAAMAAAAGAGVTVVEYSPAEIKMALTGSGRASKEQMQFMVARLLSLDGPLRADEADALAAAVCHAHSNGYAAARDRDPVGFPPKRPSGLAAWRVSRR